MALISFRRTTLWVMSWKKKLIETGLIRYQLLLFLICSMCEKLAFFFRNMDILSLK